MRFLTLYFAASCLLVLMGKAVAQQAEWPKARPEDVASPTAVVKASYDAISGPPGQPLNLDRFRSLFLPDAQLVSVRRDTGRAQARFMSVKEFCDMVISLTGREGHAEREVTERVNLYGDIANVWSSFESRSTPDDPHVTRGINGIQLMNDGNRWWISGAQWEHETPDTPLPPEYRSGGPAN